MSSSVGSDRGGERPKHSSHSNICKLAIACRCEKNANLRHVRWGISNRSSKILMPSLKYRILYVHVKILINIKLHFLCLCLLEWPGEERAFFYKKRLNELGFLSLAKFKLEKDIFVAYKYPGGKHQEERRAVWVEEQHWHKDKCL